MKKAINLSVNGVSHTDEVEPRMLLVHYLRDVLELTGTHVGCETSLCGACTVMLDGQAVKSCTMFAVQADGSSVTTIEGLAKNGELHPVQEGFWEKTRIAVRLLHAGHDHDCGAVARPERRSFARRDLPRARRQSVSLHWLPAHHRSGPIRREESGAQINTDCLRIDSC